MMMFKLLLALFLHGLVLTDAAPPFSENDLRWNTAMQDIVSLLPTGLRVFLKSDFVVDKIVIVDDHDFNEPTLQFVSISGLILVSGSFGQRIRLKAVYFLN